MNTIGRPNHIAARRPNSTPSGVAPSSGSAMFDPNAPGAVLLNAVELTDDPAQLQSRTRAVPVVSHHIQCIQVQAICFPLQQPSTGISCHETLLALQLPLLIVESCLCKYVDKPGA
jgi:hypothetical protein